MRIFTYSAFICASFWSGKRLDFQQSGLIILCILLNICCAIIRVKTGGLEVLDGVEKVLVDTPGISSPKNNLRPL
ncbi:hypothetical protein HID58_064240 [Brassica napus]|uniref:Uncharacterized protein n=1 Tax=Brassica napus TaxID=3708 RepID=A0ABQ7Z9S2_BRANA|nr:hypothetical protein HID58_064240 [Brassica napus]